MNRQTFRFRRLLILCCLILLSLLNGWTQTNYYSFAGLQNSSWHNPNTWTTTPGGIDSQDPAVPGANDIVHIVANRNVVLSQNVTTTGLTINIEAGSTLTIGTYTFAAISQLNGQGRLVIRSSYFPTITTNNLVLPGGGTVEYADFSGVIPTGQTQYNNLQFNTTNNSDNQFIVNTNLTINGNLVLLRSSASGSTRLTVGNAATVRNINVSGDVNISANSRMDVGTFNAVHEISIGGNLENNGELYLTNGARYSASTTGAANLTFTGATNNTVSGTGTTARFYRFIVDKGADPTFILDVNPSAFELWYRTDLANGGTDPNPIINKALWIKNGILKLGSNISIPKLADQDAQVSGNDFFIPLNGALWVDGATVNVTDADGGSGNTGLTVIGQFKITDGVFNGNKSAGIVFRGTAAITVGGGEVNISQFRRSTAAGVQIASYNQSGGVVNVTGIGETNDTYARFSLELGTHSFIMSGGTMNLQTPATAGILAIGSGPGYFNVTGGTINITIPTGNTNAAFCSAPPLFNLNVIKAGTGTGGLSIQDILGIGNQPLVLNNSLTLNTNARLISNNNNVSIAGNFYLATGAQYVHGTNTTRFFWNNASNNPGSVVTVEANAGDSPLTFNNLTIDKADAIGNFNTAKTVSFVSPGRTTDHALSASIITTVNGNFSFNSYRNTFNLGAYRLSVRGNIATNSNDARIDNETSSAILLNGTTQQFLALAGLNRANIFQLNNNTGAILTEAATFGRLTLINGSLNIAGNRLTIFEPVAFSGAGFSASKMIIANGSAAAGGLRYRFRGVGAGTYIYPVGVTGKYTPFTMTLAGAGIFSNEDNFIRVTPVNSVHPNVDAGDEAEAVKYYWKVQSSLVSAPLLTVAFRFDFLYADRANPAGGASGWTIYSSGSPVSNGTYNVTNPTPCFVNFNNIGFTSADFTGGRPTVFNPGQVASTFHSIASGNWNAAGTWTRVTGNTGTFPTPGDAALINPGHIVTMNINNAGASELTILSGGTLDVVSTTGHVFNSLIGDGTIRASSGVLPASDDNLAAFTQVNNSTIEYYGTGNYTLPTLGTYYNLNFTGTGTKTMANANLTIRNRMSVSGAPVLMSNLANGNLNITGQLNIENAGGILTIRSGTNRTIQANNLRVWTNAQLIVQPAGTNTHTLSLNGGGIDVLGSVDLYGNGTNVCNVILTSAGNTVIGRDARPVKLNRLTINKSELFDEVSVTALLDVAGPTNGASKALELTRGTFIIERTVGASNIDITLTSGGADFFIPSDAALIMRGSPSSANTIRSSGASGIFLDGLLSLSGNAQALLNGASNYIQYGSSGNASIEITDNAILNLGGQLRRSVSGTTDALNYYQDGGEVLIGTQGASLNTRGVFEILNSGSSFTHLDGTLEISRSSGYASGDIYLDPEIYEIGADATLTVEALAGGQNIQLRSSVPLNHLDIKGTNNPTVTLNTLPLFLEGNMIIETGSTFNTNNLSQTYHGNFTRAGSYVAGTIDTAYFRGVTQIIQGATTFNHLVIEPEVSVNLNGSSSITVNKNMAVLSGEIIDGGNTIDIKGNLTNSALHTSTNPSAGGILLSGSVLQLIDGNGTFGRMEINNASGVRLNSSINLNNNLLLTNGILNIQNNRLQLNAQSTLVGAGFGITKMIQTGGDIGDLGLRKYHSTGVSSFTYPVGSPGKYTPVSVNITANSTEAYIEIAPVNYIHPTITPPSGDPNRVLQYFWKLNSDATNMSLGMVYQYIATDVRGNESAYYSAQLNTNTDTWLKLSTGVDPIAHTVTFNQSNASNLVLNGIYTAGEETAIPNNVTIYTAIVSGDWDTPTNWDLGVSPPSGVAVTIPDGIQIRINSDRKRVYRMNLFGRLEINPATTFHNLGILTGTGTLALENDFLPPGTLGAFFSCLGGTMEYGGAGPYTITDRFNTFRNLVIRGSGVKTLPVIDINICNDLTIEGTATLKNSGGTVGYRYLNVTGNVLIRSGAGWDMSIRSWVNLFGNFTRENSTSFNTDYNSQFFDIRGSSSQQLTGNYTGVSSFNNLRLNNPGIITITGPLDIRVYGYLLNGQISNTGLFRFTRSLNGLITLTNGYITGAVQVNLGSTSPIKILPVGKGSLRKFIGLPIIVTTGNYKGEFMNVNPGVHGYNPTQMAAPLTMVSAVEYWVINGPNAGTAQLRLPLTGTSDVAAASSDLNNLRIARWSGTQWEIVGTGATYTPTINSGSVTTTANVTFNGTDQIFTLATIDPTLKSTAQFTTGNVSICSGGSTVLTVAFTGISPWNFSYSDGVTTFNETNVTSPFNINVSPAVTRTYTLTAVSDINGAGTIFGSPVIVTVHPTPALYNVTGGGSYCMGAAIPVGLSGSQIGMTYELLQDAAPTGISMAGTGAAISFAGVTQAGTYTVRAFNTANPSCEQMMTGSAIVVVNPLPTATISVVPPLDFICSEEYTRFSVAMTGSSPWSITYTDGTGTWTRNGILTNPYEFDSDEVLLWIDGGSGPAPRSINFTITNVTDANCSNTGSGTATINVYRRPETGPQFHIPNTFGN